MSASFIRCPNCGGDVDLDAKKCPYCDSDILFDDYDEREKDVRNILIAARNDLSSMRYIECRSHLDDVLAMESNCSDAWYISAALYMADKAKFEQEMKHARSCSKDYGIFNESDLDSVRKVANVQVIKNIRLYFLIFGFMVLFFGGMISLAFGIAFGTVIPIIITVGILIFMIIIYLLATLRYRI